MSKPDITSNDVIEWDFRIPMVTNGFVMGDMFKVVGLSVGFSCLLMLAIGAFQGRDGFVDMLHIVPVFLVCLVMFAHGFPVRFTVSKTGVTYEVTRSQRKMNSAILWMGILSGGPGVAGSAMLAQSQEAGSYGWENVYRVDLFPRKRTVVLRNSWRTILRVYCTAENYGPVAHMAVDGVEAHADERSKNCTEAKTLRHSIFESVFNRWSALAFVSGILVTASPFIDMDDSAGLVLTIGVVVLFGGMAWRGLRTALGVFGLVGCVFLIVLMAVEASRTGFTIASTVFSNWDIAVDNHKGLLITSIVGLLGMIACSIRSIVTGRATR